MFRGCLTMLFVSDHVILYNQNQITSCDKSWYWRWCLDVLLQLEIVITTFDGVCVCVFLQILNILGTKMTTIPIESGEGYGGGEVESNTVCMCLCV